jgi:hypothetical protein
MSSLAPSSISLRYFFFVFFNRASLHEAVDELTLAIKYLPQVFFFYFIFYVFLIASPCMPYLYMSALYVCVCRICVPFYLFIYLFYFISPGYRTVYGIHIRYN